MKEKLILIGGGGHCRSCIDVIEQNGRYEISGILDQEEMLGSDILGYKISGTDNDIARLAAEGYSFLITIGQVRTPAKRIELFETLMRLEAKMATVVSPHAYVSGHAAVGEGTIVMHGALVNASATIGANCIINSKAIVEHDALVENHCHISTAAVVNGTAVVREGAFFGSNAVCKEGAEIPKNAFVKAGSVYKG